MVDHSKDDEKRLREIGEREKAASENWHIDDVHVFGMSTQWANVVGPRKGRDVFSGSLHKDDAAFIAHARTDIPWLLSRLREEKERNHRRCSTCGAIDPNTNGFCSNGFHVTRKALLDRLSAAEARAEKRLNILESQVPHDPCCNSRHGEPCDCWHADLIKAAREEG